MMRPPSPDYVVDWIKEEERRLNKEASVAWAFVGLQFLCIAFYAISIL